jgi:cytochrome b pre-mRNA-processing protein 3
MLSTLRKLFVPKPPEAVNATYIALVAAARNPFFYTELKVPDTLDGRFEMIVLHAFLLQHRLMVSEGASPTPAPELPVRSGDGRREPERSERGGAVAGAQRPHATQSLEHFAQFLSEAFFYDMDNSIRELGVADTGVAHRIKKMGKAYHGRLQAYTAGLTDATALRAALARNLYGTVENGDVNALNRLAVYVEKMTAHLAETDTATITSGNYAWPDVASMGV